MPVVLAYNALAAQFPKPRVVIAARCDQIRTIRAEGAVPYPALVAMQCGFQGKGSGVPLSGCRQVVARLQVVRHRGVEGPYAGGVVGGAGREVAHVGREQDAGDVCAVGGELADGNDGGGVVALDHTPDVDVALWRPC